VDLSEELLGIFTDEAAGRLGVIAAGLLRLEAGADPDLVTELFREAHTVKGAAAVVGLDAVSRVAHAMEDLFQELRDGSRTPTHDFVDVLLAAVDGLRILLPAMRMGTDISAEADRLGVMVARFRSGTVPGRGAEPQPQRAPAPVPVPEPGPHGPGAVVAVAPEPSVAVAPQAGPRPAEALRGDAVRVPITRLDALVRLVGETASANLRVGRLLVDRLGPAATDLDPVRDLARSLNELQEMTMRARMVPIASILEPLRRAVRDLSRDLGKSVRWEARGLETELDRGVLNELGDALLHLVRNAVDHGVEPPDERRASGKPPEATIAFHAMQLGSEVVVTVADDGRGIDLGQVRAQAVRRDPDSDRLDDDEILELVFLSGLSTAPRVTDVSGRGVGLDVVLHGIDAVRGRIEVRSRPGEGTEFRIRVPITLAVLPCLLVSCADQRYAIPMHSIVVVQETADHTAPLWVEGQPVDVTALASVLGLAGGTAPDRRAATVVVVAGPTRRHGFAVDALLGQRDVVVKGLSGLLPRIDVLTGASIEPDGSVLCILDGGGLVERARGAPPGPDGLERPPPRASLLVVDDAVTVRELQRAILERAGYAVRTAADGPAALAVLAESPADLVLTDVEMRGMDGFELTRAIRATGRLESLPVIILTSRATDEDRRRGLEAGADAYLPKSAFDQGDLVAAVERLLGPGRPSGGERGSP